MTSFWAIAAVLGLAILILITLAAVVFYRSRCPRCGRCGLKFAGSYHSTGRDGHGYRQSERISLYFCTCCSARLRWNLRSWSDAAEDEWKKHAHITARQLAAGAAGKQMNAGAAGEVFPVSK
jgi:hypothetical protein